MHANSSVRLHDTREARCGRLRQGPTHQVPAIPGRNYSVLQELHRFLANRVNAQRRIHATRGAKPLNPFGTPFALVSF